MSLYIFDTDHVTLHQRAHPHLLAEIAKRPSISLALTIITVEEQMRGRLAQLSSKESNLVVAYEQFLETVTYFCGMNILPFDVVAQNEFRRLRQQRIRIGTLDLRIAAVALTRNAVLITRNKHDFEQVPNIKLEDWTQ
jgi:tRNA(fMet)-specific endonuclease VapC